MSFQGKKKADDARLEKANDRFLAILFPYPDWHFQIPTYSLIDFDISSSMMRSRLKIFHFHFTFSSHKEMLRDHLYTDVINVDDYAQTGLSSILQALPSSNEHNKLWKQLLSPQMRMILASFSHPLSLIPHTDNKKDMLYTSMAFIRKVWYVKHTMKRKEKTGQKSTQAL